MLYCVNYKVKSNGLDINEDQYLSSLVFHLANYRQYDGSLFTETDIKGRQENVLAKTRKLYKSGIQYVEKVVLEEGQK